MTTEMIVVVMCYVIAMVFAFIFLRPKKDKQPVVQQPQVTESYEELLNILDLGIKSEITYKYKMDYKMKDIRIIYDFEQDLTEITTNVMQSFSQSFLLQLERYHNREFIIKYVSRQIQLFLLQYMKENKITTK